MEGERGTGPEGAGTETCAVFEGALLVEGADPTAGLRVPERCRMRPVAVSQGSGLSPKSECMYCPNTGLDATMPISKANAERSA